MALEGGEAKEREKNMDEQEQSVQEQEGGGM